MLPKLRRLLGGGIEPEDGAPGDLRVIDASTGAADPRRPDPHDAAQEVVADLQKRFGFGRVVFVGDRGMVTAEDLEWLERAHPGFVVGLDRRRGSELKGGLDLLDDTKKLSENGRKPLFFRSPDKTRAVARFSQLAQRFCQSF